MTTDIMNIDHDEVIDGLYDTLRTKQVLKDAEEAINKEFGIIWSILDYETQTAILRDSIGEPLRTSKEKELFINAKIHAATQREGLE